MRSQIDAHQLAVTVFQNEINNGREPDTKNYATKHLPHIQMHLQRADSNFNALDREQYDEDDVVTDDDDNS